MLLLAASQHAPSAPGVAGRDVERYQQLVEDLRARIGPAVAERIADLAAGMPRAQVVDRARAAVAELCPARVTGEGQIRWASTLDRDDCPTGSA